MITVICPVLNEEGFIAKCIESIIGQDITKDNLELIIADGRSTDKTREIVQKYSKQHPWIKLIDNPERIVPTALNRAVREARGEYIVRIDGHCTYPANYVSLLVHYLDELDASNVGCVWNTLPVNQSIQARAIATAMRNPFGIGNSTYRIGTSDIKKVDTVPFGCFRRSLFDKIGFFDEELTRNQDDEFNARIIKNGGSIYLIPQLTADYYARATVSKMSKMFYQYGLFKPLVNKKIGYPATIRQLFPIAFLLVFALLLVIGFVNACAWALLGLMMLTHILAGIVLSVLYGAKKELILMLIPVYFMIHMSYGAGYLKGIFNLVFQRNEQVTITR